MGHSTAHLPEVAVTDHGHRMADYQFQQALPAPWLPRPADEVAREKGPSIGTQMVDYKLVDFSRDLVRYVSWEG